MTNQRVHRQKGPRESPLRNTGTQSGKHRVSRRLIDAGSIRLTGNDLRTTVENLVLALPRRPASPFADVGCYLDNANSDDPASKAFAV